MQHWDNPKPDFKWPVAMVHSIAAPVGEVWDAISMPGNLELCHPFCAKNPVLAWPGEGAIDEIHYLSGWVFQRRFCRWIENVGYDLEIGKKDGPTSFVSWRLQPVGEKQTALRIAVYPWALQNVPAAIRWLPYTLRLKPLLAQYLSSVVRGFEWYIVKKEPVPRNQFGFHTWFS